MTIRDEFEKAKKDWWDSTKNYLREDSPIPDPTLWAAKWMAERCERLIKERYIGSCSSRLQREIRQLAKELSNDH